MNIRRVKQGARITYYNGIYMILFGIFFISFMQFNMKTSFKSIEELWGFFAKFNPEIAKLFILMNILLAIFFISNGILISYLSDFIIKRKEKMTWVILFISGIISWAGLLTISIFIKNMYLIIPGLIGWLTFAFGMLLPIKYYLEKDYREY